jgi:hypothetical protein
MSTAYTHIPPGAIRTGFTGWKPSGILSITVVPTVILRSVPAFLPGETSADASLLR